MMETFVAQVSRVDDLTHDVRQLQLELRRPDAIRFQAGQFVSFSIDAPGLPYAVTRPYSIASSPSRPGAIDLLFNLVPGGPGSTYLHSLKTGDEVTFRGPAGTFVLRDYPDRRLLFVATGTGIAPIRSMILARLPSRTPVTLVWGLRAERDLYYQDDFAALAARHPEFSFTTVLSRPSSSWTGPGGRVQPLVERFAATVDDLAVYVCGNSSMIASVRSLIRSRGVCPVHFEQYYKDTALDDDGGRTPGSP
jgi:NAD(P)H-flavin reductase